MSCASSLHYFSPNIQEGPRDVLPERICLKGSPLSKFLSFAQNAELLTAIAELIAGVSSGVGGTNLAKLVFLPDFGIRVGSQ